MIGLMVVANLASLPCLVWKAEGRAEAERDTDQTGIRARLLARRAGGAT